MEKKQYTNVKVVTRNFIIDFFAKLQNLTGSNMTSYERMVQKAIKQLEDDMERDGVVLEWYRYEITQLMNGAMTVMIYGDKREE
jgi:uncharacterized protein YbjQ (UPF0145 family)